MAQEPKWSKIEPPQTPAWNGKNAEGKFPLKPGDTFIGTYVGAKTGLGPRKDATLFQFKKENGEEVGIWGSAILMDKLGTLKFGELTKIQYLGDVQGKTPGTNPYHNYDVWHTEQEGKDELPTVQEGEEPNPTIQEQLDMQGGGDSETPQ